MEEELTYFKENAEAIVAATREIGLQVSADKTKYMVTNHVLSFISTYLLSTFHYPNIIWVMKSTSMTYEVWQ